MSVTASQTVGYSTKIPLVQVEIEFRATMSQEMSRIATESYELSVSKTYSAGPLEDKVVFAAVPVDVYTYRVLTHPEPKLVGTPAVRTTTTTSPRPGRSSAGSSARTTRACRSSTACGGTT